MRLQAAGIDRESGRLAFGFRRFCGAIESPDGGSLVKISP